MSLDLTRRSVKGTPLSAADHDGNLDKIEDRILQVASLTDYGAVAGSTPAGAPDSTAAIQAALTDTTKDIYIPDGYFRVVDSNLDGTPVLTSAIANRRIYGPGILTATSQVYRLLRVTGDDTEVSIRVDGNDNIGVAVQCVGAKNPHVHHCRIRDLNGFANWQAIGAQVNIDGLDTQVRIHDNEITNVQGVGDGTAGNGVGMNRAIAVEHDAAQTNPINIYDNDITDVQGEEGDCITVISSNGAGTYYAFPVNVWNNDIHGWTRRAVKVQASNANIDGNRFSQNLSSDPGSLESVVDLVQGGDHTVTNNKFRNCLYQAQISMFLDAGEAADNVTVAGNTIEGLGAETTSAPITLQTYGTGVQVLGNTINCPNLAVEAFRVWQATDPLIAGNITRLDSATWLSTTNSTGVRLGQNTHNGGVSGMPYGTWWDVDSGHLYVDLSTGSRKLVLMQRDTVLADGEVIAQIACQQNDASFPAGIHSSVRFVAAGTAGSTGIELRTGSGASPESTGIRVATNGVIEPINFDSQRVGDAGKIWNRGYFRELRPGAGDRIWTNGTGTPEGSVTAPVGSMYTRSDGGAGTTLYVKESGTGNTGWVAK